MEDNESRIEFWCRGRSLPGLAREAAVRAEREGWDGITFIDSQNTNGDPYFALSVAGAATERLRLGTGVTNPLTRHPAVTASAISCVNEEFGGRAELGVGRGDSSLAHLGLAPVSPARFEEFLDRTQDYLSGRPVAPLDARGAAASTAQAVHDTSTVAHEPVDSRLRWLAELSARKVPVFSVASGPKMIDVAARRADRVALALGADVDRLRWGVQAARRVNPRIPVAAYVHVLVHDDLEVATRAIAGGVAGFARFSAMHGRSSAPVAAADGQVMESVARAYDLNRHFQGDSAQAEVITVEFARRFAIIGGPRECVDRLTGLAALGIDRFHVELASRDQPADLIQQVRERFVTEVLPEVRHAPVH